MKTVPRAIYFLSPLTALNSILKLTFGIKLKRANIVNKFENEFAQLVSQKHAYATSHARIVFLKILESLQLENDSEVIMTPINLPDMANAILMNNLKPRFIDYLPNSIEPDLELLKTKLNKKSKVFFYTHLYGIVPNLDLIKEFCQDNNLIFIQDCTQSVGALYKNKDISNYSIYNFYSLCDLKVVQTHRGGIFTSNDLQTFKRVSKSIQETENSPNRKYFLKFIFEDLIFSIILRRKIYYLFLTPFLRKLYKDQNQDLIVSITRGEGFKIGGHFFLKNLFGDEGSYIRKKFPENFFYHFTELQAQIGLNTIQKIKKSEQKRIENTLLFLKQIKLNISTVSFLKLNQDSSHVFWKVPLITKYHQKVQSSLFQKSIDSAPINLPVIPEINEFNFSDLVPNASLLRNNGLCIPLHYYLKKNEIIEIANAINETMEITNAT